MPTPKLKVIDGQLVARDAPPARADLPYVTRLASLQDIKKDALKVYRAARQGRIDTQEMSRFMYGATAITNIVDKADIEPRLDALESRLDAILAKLT